MHSSSSSLVKKVIRRLSRTIRKLLIACQEWINQLAMESPLFSVFQEAYTLEGYTRLTLYATEETIFPQYKQRVNPRAKEKIREIQVSLIATALNEADSIEAWMNAILRQTRLPDEIIIVDSGSTDKTFEILTTWQARSNVPLFVFQITGGNISLGRNTAIRNASYPVIAVTDFGANAHPDWLEKLLSPFEIDPAIEFSGGWYSQVKPDRSNTKFDLWSFSSADDPSTIFSPGASMAFTRNAWEKAGGFPEWLTHSGEDTYFNLEIRRNTRSAAFVPQALVDWVMPASANEMWKKLAYWSYGDGEIGIHSRYYLYAFIQLLWTAASILSASLLILFGLGFERPPWFFTGVAISAAWIMVLCARAVVRKYSFSQSVWKLSNSIAMALGFLAGSRRRLKTSQARLKTLRGLFFILAGVPIDDSGGGSRFAQIALEMIRQQYCVVYLYAFPKGERADLRIRINHPNLYQYPARYFSLNKFTNRFNLRLEKNKCAALVEVPLRKWMPLLSKLSEKNIPIIYDLVDDWETSLGGEWYEKEIEREIAQMATTHTATISLLAERLEKLCEKPVTILPNAVNSQLFDPEVEYKRPADFPHFPRSLIYMGALYGNWFDWDLLQACCVNYPECAIVVIGDYHGQYRPQQDNLFFLDLKKHAELPAYLAAADVAIIPWKVDEITLVTNPLKIYEFLTMKKPVVIPALPELQNFPGVLYSHDREEFLRNIASAFTYKFNQGEWQDFLAGNSWETRVKQLIQAINIQYDGVDP